VSLKPLIPKDEDIVEEELIINKPEVTEMKRNSVPRLSHTQVSMFLRCPRQYMFRYLEGIKLPPAGAMIQGSAYHSAIEYGYKTKLNTNTEPSVDLVKEVANQAWIDKLSEETDIVWGGHPGKLKDQMIVLVEKYVSETMPLIIPKSVEDKEVVYIEDIPFVRVRDLLTKDGVVVDHKLSKKKYSVNQKYSDLQSLAYLYPDGGKFNYHVAVKKNHPEVQVIDFSRTKDEIDWWVSMVKMIAKQIALGVFPPNPTGWSCNPTWCGYFDICRGKNRRSFKI